MDAQGRRHSGYQQFPGQVRHTVAPNMGAGGNRAATTARQHRQMMEKPMAWWRKSWSIRIDDGPNLQTVEERRRVRRADRRDICFAQSRRRDDGSSKKFDLGGTEAIRIITVGAERSEVEHNVCEVQKKTKGNVFVPRKRRFATEGRARQSGGRYLQVVQRAHVVRFLSLRRGSHTVGVRKLSLCRSEYQ